jgi:hypothetical protein
MRPTNRGDEVEARAVPLPGHPYALTAGNSLPAPSTLDREHMAQTILDGTLFEHDPEPEDFVAVRWVAQGRPVPRA